MGAERSTGRDRASRRRRQGGALRAARTIALAGLAALVVGGVILAVASDGFGVDGETMERWLDDLGPWGPAAVVALMVVHCFVPFPAEILALCAGAAFGTAAGTALIWLGAMLGAALSFGLARALGRTAVERFLSARSRRRLDGWTVDHGASTLLISRLIPVIAFNLINYAAGLTRVGWWTFLWTTAVGILPITVLVVHMGAQMTQLSWPLVVGVSVAAIGAVIVLDRLCRRYGWLARWRGDDAAAITADRFDART